MGHGAEAPTPLQVVSGQDGARPPGGASAPPELPARAPLAPARPPRTRASRPAERRQSREPRAGLQRALGQSGEPGPRACAVRRVRGDPESRARAGNALFITRRDLSARLRLRDPEVSLWLGGRSPRELGHCTRGLLSPGAQSGRLRTCPPGDHT